MTETQLLQNVVANLKDLCGRKKLTQTELAKRAGVHYVTVNRIFRGHLQPSLTMLEKLAGGLKVHPAKLFAELNNSS